MHLKHLHLISFLLCLPNLSFDLTCISCFNFRMLVEQLERVNVTQMELNAQIAFWINVYNALIMHVMIF